MDHPIPTRTASTDTVTSILSRSGYKGKGRGSRVSFAPEVDERSPLLSKYADNVEGRDEESGYTEESNNGESSSLPSRLHRKLKKGLLVGRGSMRKSGYGLPYYPGDDMDDTETSKVMLYATCFFILICVIVGAGVLVQSAEHYPTGPYPRPPTPFPSPPFPSGLPRNPAFLAQGKNGAVASENKDCSEIGVDMLKAGGSAADAAVASALCIGTINMFSSGIGGGGFMTLRIPPNTPSENSTVWTIDFREPTPAAGNATMFGNDPDSSRFGGLSVGIPSELKGLHEAHKRWGKLPWERVVMPSAILARGWSVGPELDKKMKWFGTFILANPDWRPIFAPHGKLLEKGDTIRRTNYAHTLEVIANRGIDAFYSRHSPIARSIIKKIASTGGIMTFDDLENYEVKVARAIQGTYRGRKVYTTDAPTSGPALLHMLRLVEQYDLPKEGHTPLNIHRIVEAQKFGFAARTWLSDPITPEDVGRMAPIATKNFAKEVISRMDDNSTHTADYYNPIYDVSVDHGTTHLSAVDQEGMAVTLTSTINLPWGSQVLDVETGIILNDELDDFSRQGMPNSFGLWPSPYNYPGAGKRPLSSITPTIIEHADGRLYCALGDWGMDVSQAIEAPRVHDQLFPAFVSLETGIDKEVSDALKAKGHNVTVFDINLGVAEVQAVVVDKHGYISAASDSRKNGVAVAY